MDLPATLLILVLSGSAFAQDAPRITIKGAEADTPAEPEGRMPGGEAMQQLLNWGIENSDPERIKELMQMYKDKNLTIKDVYGQDMIDALFVNEGSVMKNMTLKIADFANASVTDEDLENSLQTLQDMVEQVDNAGNLHRMGGLRPLLELSTSGSLVSSQPEEVRRSESVRALALWTLGVAMQNNEPVQTDTMDIGGLSPLLSRLPVCTSDKAAEAAGEKYCGKLLFAVSALVKNNETIQAAADAQGLFDWLLEHGIAHQFSSVAKKSMGLLDIALSQSPHLQVLSSLPEKQEFVANALLKHISGELPDSDTDAAEKAIRLVNRLLSLRPMLFRPIFRSELAGAVASATKICERVRGSGDELCEGLTGLAQLADLALAARELSDDEL